MKQQTILVVAGIVFVFGQCVWALQQSSDANNLEALHDYLRYALLNNAELKTKFYEWKAALEQIPQAKSLPDPKFTYGYFIDEVETRVGPQRQKFGIMQVFPWIGKIEARAGAAAAAAKAARKRYEAAKLKLFFEVKSAYYEYAYLADAVRIARQNLELLKHFEEVARTKYIVATATHPDVIRSQVEMAKLEDILKSLEELTLPLVAKLNSILNRQSDLPLAWPRKQKFRLIWINREGIIAKLQANNPQLAALDFEIVAAKSRVDLAKKKFWPDVGVGVDWIQTDGAISSGVRDSGKDPVLLTFSMNLPLWRDSYKAAERQAKMNLKKTSQQKTETENVLLARAAQILYDFEDSNRKTSLYGDVLVPKSEELLEASEIAYRGGTVDFLSLIDAQRTLLKFELRYERAVTDSQQKLAELEMLVATQLSTEVKSPIE